MRGKAAFADLRRNGRRTRHAPITVTFSPNAEDGPPEVGFAIGRKVGSAVVRNRLRRRLRVIVAEPGPHHRSGRFLIGVAPEAAPLDFGELRSVVLGTLSEAVKS